MLRHLKILGLLLFISTANAIELTDLYQAKVTVTSQSNGEKNNALKQAMRQVLLKVGGQSSVLADENVKKALNNYQQFIAQYSYQRENGKIFLIAQFDENKINHLFYQAGLSLWGNLRPQILLWLIEEEGFERQVVAESSNAPYPFIVQQFSQQRGLPISMPLMDLTDVESISIVDLWGRFIEPIKAASKRYQAEAIVVFRLSNSSLLPQANDEEWCEAPCPQNSEPAKYALDWRLFTQSEQLERTTQPHFYQGNDKTALFKQALQEMTQEIYEFYALNSAENHQVEIDVVNIDSLEGYVEVFNFLSNLSSVKSVQLVSANGQNRRFRLDLLGDKQTLLASLKLNKQLRQQADLTPFRTDNIPVFYWVK
jgi:hypothetical protein